MSNDWHAEDSGVQRELDAERYERLHGPVARGTLRLGPRCVTGDAEHDLVLAEPTSGPYAGTSWRECRACGFRPEEGL